jgi:Rps23 Pro-64 3,4-dihydroxylase Tpa1-like proline 4-hydroxylase
MKLSEINFSYLSKYINKKYLDENFLKEQKNKFSSWEFVNCLVFDNFFNEDIVLNIEKDLDKWSNMYSEFTQDIKGYKKWGWFFAKWKTLSKIDTLFRSKHFLSYMSFLYSYEVVREKNFLFSLERFLFKMLSIKWIYVQSYNNWDFLDWHTDWPVWVVWWSFLYYFNKDWKKEYGWLLQLWKFNWVKAESYKDIIPSMNKFVIIKCEKDKSWHKITKLESNTTRISFHDQFFIKD